MKCNFVEHSFRLFVGFEVKWEKQLTRELLNGLDVVLWSIIRAFYAFNAKHQQIVSAVSRIAQWRIDILIYFYSFVDRCSSRFISHQVWCFNLYCLIVVQHRTYCNILCFFVNGHKARQKKNWFHVTRSQSIILNHQVNVAGTLIFIVATFLTFFCATELERKKNVRQTVKNALVRGRNIRGN